jgi:alkaline phosphatase
MKLFIACLILIFSGFVGAGQKVLIHSHNDYETAEPLLNAIRNRAYSLEADVYLVNDTLKVAHDKKDLTKASSLFTLYIQPIVNLFRTHNGRISDDAAYMPVFMIDIKENGDAVLTKLVSMLTTHASVFDRKMNPGAIQIVISGDRGDRLKWTTWPSFILFDGRIGEQYDKPLLERVAFISDSYFNYARHTDSTDYLIKQLAEKSHQMEKLLRLWAIPDNPSSWSHLRKLGVDIINTDNVSECRRYFSSIK